MKKILLIISLPLLTILFISMQYAHIWNNDTPVEDVLLELGKAKELHSLSSLEEKKIQQGMEIVTQGYTHNDEGKKTKRQSKYFLCTDCHATQPEYFYDGVFTAEARLKNAKTNNMPYLAGSSFYGTVNKKSWYNGDYVKKYGTMAKNAHDTLRNAIQLCATECSQGRALKPWEMDAVLSYFWSLQLKMGDLHLDESEWNTITSSDKTAAQKTIHKHLQQELPLTFLDPIPVNDRTASTEGNIANGKYIFQKGCLHCHSRASGATHFKLEDNKLTHKYLKSYLLKWDEKSIYNIVREGTYPVKGHKPYMPLYPEEKMSKEQLKDLVAYIVSMAE